jgi:hypothetical protein
LAAELLGKASLTRLIAAEWLVKEAALRLKLLCNGESHGVAVKAPMVRLKKLRFG